MAVGACLVGAALVASKAAGTLFWMLIGVAALAWCAPRNKERETRQPATSSYAPLPLLERAPQAGGSEPSRPSTSRLGASPTPMSKQMYATANLNIRAEPSTSADVLGQVPKGASVLGFDQQGDWYRIRHNGKSGWIHAGYVSQSPQTEREPERPLRTLAPTTVAPTARAFSGRAVRAPYVGTCDCPYDLKRNGARCGGTSAYSRPGGREPECYE